MTVLEYDKQIELVHDLVNVIVHTSATSMLPCRSG